MYKGFSTFLISMVHVSSVSYFSVSVSVSHFRCDSHNGFHAAREMILQSIKIWNCCSVCVLSAVLSVFCLLLCPLDVAIAVFFNDFFFLKRNFLLCGPAHVRIDYLLHAAPELKWVWHPCCSRSLKLCCRPLFQVSRPLFEVAWSAILSLKSRSQPLFQVARSSSLWSLCFECLSMLEAMVRSLKPFC